MAYALGIDIGTTFSAAAISRDGRVEIVAFDSNRVTVPTVVYSDEDGELFGTAAAARSASHPEGLARAFKRRLGDTVPVMLSGAPYSADRLMAMFARWIVDTISAQLGEGPSTIVLTHPANWSQFQIELFRKALQHVDLDDVRFVSEPEAAAYDYSVTAQADGGDVLLVYDLGGGTFDVALLRREKSGFTFVGDPAGVERLGGIDFDEAVLQHVVRHLPPDAAQHAAGTAAGRLALMQLRRGCIEAKEELSSNVVVDIPAVLPDAATTIRLTRREFEAMIRPMLEQTVALVRRVITSADQAVGDLAAILLIGGSSRTPLVSDLMSTALDATIRVDAHPKLVVARGAARLAAGADDAGTGDLVPRGRRRWAIVAGSVLAVALLALAVTWIVRNTTEPESVGSVGVTDLTYIGHDDVGSDVVVGDGAVLGLSGIAYEADSDLYYVLSEDSSVPHLYRVRIAVGDGRMERGDVTFTDELKLTSAEGSPLPAGLLQPEGLAFSGSGAIAVSNEGDASVLDPSSLFTFTLDGNLTSERTSPPWYHAVVDGSSGAVAGGGFKAVATHVRPGTLLVGAARSLVQDVRGDPGGQPFVRLLEYDETDGSPGAEYGYPLDAPTTAPTATSTAPSGPATSVAPTPPTTPTVSRLEELVSLGDDHTLLALEVVEFASGLTTRIYEVRLPDEPPAAADGTPPALLEKRLLVDFSDELQLPSGDYQGLTLGPPLPSGERGLIVVSDNKSGESITPQSHFVAFALELS